jgi:DNA-binding MurR/RpiR family transcriptional regulator
MYPSREKKDKKGKGGRSINDMQQRPCFFLLSLPPTERETERTSEEIDQTDIYKIIAITTTKTINHFFTHPHVHTIDDPDDFDRVNCFSLYVYFSVNLHTLLT